MSVETVETFPAEQKFDDQELFDHAEAVEAPEVPEAPAAEVDQPEPEVVVSEPQAEKPVVDDNAPQVPSWRVREINEEKRALAEKVAALEAEKATWQRPQTVQPPPAAVEKPAKPDPLLDPDGYAKAVRDEVREEILTERRESSMAAAHGKYKTEFEEAYQAATKVVDPALKARMQASRDPGETLIQWHRERKAQDEIGGDLTAYKQRLREEALKDPEFRKQAMEAWRSDAQTQQNGRPNVALPPTLSGASRSSLSAVVDTDISDEGLWQHVNA